MALLLILVGFLAIIVAGVVTLFTLGSVAAAVVVIALIALISYTLAVAKTLRTLTLAAVAAVLLIALGYGGLSAYQLYSSLGSTEGAVEPADPQALLAANAKIDAAKEQGAFNIDLTDEELSAVLQDTLADSSDNPIRAVELEIVDGDDDEQGAIDFEVSFKNGGLAGHGRIGASLDAGQINLDIKDVALGRISLPGVATGAMEDLIETVLDLNEKLAESHADIQAIEIGQGRVHVVGTQGDGELLTAGSLLDAIETNVDTLAGAAVPPPEVIGPGEVNSTSSDGDGYVVAIGDSIAANVGVLSAREGMVSRFLKAVSAADGQEYGLRNFGVSGETSGTIIHSGQLNDAVDFIRDNEVAYIVVSIGANDLLGHLASPDCADDLQAPPCQARLNPSLEAFRANFDRILGRLDGDARDARIVVLSIYNPFSLGFGGNLGVEETSDAAVDSLNAMVAEIAAAHDAVVADGRASMQDTTAATTHMLDNPPDVHPNSAGYDLLAQALVNAVE